MRARSLPVATTVVLAVWLVLLPAAPAGAVGAHVRSSTGYSEVRSDAGGDVRYDLSLEYEPLVAAAALGRTASEAGDDQSRATALTAGEAATRLASYLTARLRVFVDEAECEGALEGSEIEQRDSAAFARLRLGYDCPGSGDGRYRIRYTVFSESDVVVDDHTNVVDYDLGGRTGRVVLDAQMSSFVAGEGGVLATIARFGGLGIEHLVGGIDHILFLVVLLLGASSLAGVAKVASMFTLAHSLTLALAALGWVSIPGAIVEPLIALSIAFVAAENLLGLGRGERDGRGAAEAEAASGLQKPGHDVPGDAESAVGQRWAGDSRQRLAVVFAFGLLHGLGFASSMSFTDDLSWSLAASLVGFNAGIEIAQAALLLVLFPLVALARKVSWSNLAHATATGTVAAVGLVWFFQRLTLT